jgi:hypothetical protein
MVPSVAGARNRNGVQLVLNHPTMQNFTFL